MTSRRRRQPTPPQQPPPSEEFVLEHSLYDDEAERIYSEWVKKPKKVNVETAFKPNPQRHRYADGNLAAMIEARQWHKLANPTRAANLSVVWEFYANARSSRADNIVTVRGVVVSFDVEVIRAYYELPTIENDEYIELMGGTVDYQSMLQELGQPGETWKTSSSSSSLTCSSKWLSKYGKAWNHFICGNLMPSSNPREIHKERLAVLHCICSHKVFDAAAVIKTHLLNSIRLSNQYALGFGSLVTGLCEAAGVPMSDAEVSLPIKETNHGTIESFTHWDRGTPQPDGLGFILPEGEPPVVPSTGPSKRARTNSEAAGPSSSRLPGPSSMPASGSAHTLDSIGTMLTEMRLENQRNYRRTANRLEELHNRDALMAQFFYYQYVYPNTEEGAQQPQANPPEFPMHLMDFYSSPTPSDEDRQDEDRDD